VLQSHPKSLVRLLSPSNPSLADALASDASPRNRKDPLLPSGTLFSCQGPTLRSFRTRRPIEAAFLILTPSSPTVKCHFLSDAGRGTLRRDNLSAPPNIPRPPAQNQETFAQQVR